MILSPVPLDLLPAVLKIFAERLRAARARAVFRRIAEPAHCRRAAGLAAAAHHAQALLVLGRLGMGVKPGAPQADVSWDGAAARIGTEAYVLLHEAAHFQLAAPERRRRVDFGLGPGPETGNHGAAHAAASLFGLDAEREEATASLLGILWETELGHPALASFLDQNWLEGAHRTGTAEHFEATLERLREGGFVTCHGHPTWRLRRSPDQGHSGRPALRKPANNGSRNERSLK
jgi:hypothetical protein